MIAIYERTRANGYEILNTVHGYDDDELLRNLHGPSRQQSWKPILMQLDRPTRRGASKAADLPFMLGALVLRRSAVDALQDILETHGELLPLATNDGVELFVFNPRFVIDAIDKENSEIERIPDTKAVLIRKYVFIESMIRDIDIFRVPLGPRMPYFSDRFVERVKKAKLKGTEFIKLWSSDDEIASHGATVPLQHIAVPDLRVHDGAQGAIVEMNESAGMKRARAMAALAPTHYATLKAETERRVVRWQWASFAVHSYEPAYFEIEKFKPGRLLAREPDPPESGAHGYGYDAEGRIVIELRQTDEPGVNDESFYVHEPDGIAAYAYNYYQEKEWVNVQWFAIRDGRVEACYSVYAQDSVCTMTYQYDELGRMVRRDRHSTNPSEPRRNTEDWHEVEYDATGQIVRVTWCYPDGKRYLEFERPARDATLKARKRDLLRGLTAAIVDAIRQADVKDEVYAVTLAHLEALYQQRLPPMVGLGTVSERQRFVQQHGDNALEMIWNPAEWKWRELDLNLSPQLATLCASVNQDIWQNELQAEANAFLADLARALNKAELPVRRADGFVSLTVALDIGDYCQQVQEQVNARTVQKLRRGGWLPGHAKTKLR